MSESIVPPATHSSNQQKLDCLPAFYRFPGHIGASYLYNKVPIYYRVYSHSERVRKSWDD